MINHPILYGNSEHAFLFDLNLEEKIKLEIFVPELDKALLKNEWIHVELNVDSEDEDEKNKILRKAQMGIHVWKEKRNTEEDYVIFTNPYSKMRKLDEYLDYSNTSLLQFVPPLKKQRLVEVGVSETENLHQQHLAALLSGMRNLVLTETKE